MLYFFINAVVILTGSTKLMSHSLRSYIEGAGSIIVEKLNH